MSRQLVETGSMPVLHRAKEIRLAIQRLDSLRAGSNVEDCVLFYYGVPTVGKSTLLREIKKEAENNGTATALIDFDREIIDKERGIDHDSYDEESGQVRLARKLMQELIDTGGYLERELITETMSPNQAAACLIEFVRKRYGAHRPFVLFFDTVEDADSTTFRWLQDQILSPMIDNEFNEGEQLQVLVVMAGRTKPNLTVKEIIFRIERRLRAQPLQPFTRQQTAEQFVKMNADADVRDVNIYEFTGGLPGLNDQAARWIVKEKADVTRKNDKKDETDAALAHHLVDDVIFGRLARKQKESSAKFEKTREIMLAVAPLRQFDADLLERIIGTPVLFGTEYAGIGFRGISQLIRDLQQTRLVEPHPDGYGYIVVGHLRLVLDKFWRQTEPEKHLCVQQIAAEWFQAQVKQKDFPAIADRIYYLSGLRCDINEHPRLAARLEESLHLLLQQNERQLLTQELEEVLQDVRIIYANNLNRALKQMEKIKSVLLQPEFNILISAAVIALLIEQCDRFRSNPEYDFR